MRTSSVLMLGLAGLATVFGAGCSISTTDNSITIGTVPEYVDDSYPEKSSSAWTGQAIVIQNDGVNPAIGDSGVVVTVDPNATKVTVKAVLAARAEVKADADASIVQAAETFRLDETADRISIVCGHGGGGGTAQAASSGCKLLQVVIPVGSSSQPVDLTIGSGNGGIVMRGAPQVSSLTVDSNGSGDVQAAAVPLPGSKVTVVGGDAVALSLPSTFSSKSVVFTVDGSSGSEAAARILTPDFPGLENGSPWPLAGATADAAESINVWTKGILDSDTITVRALN